MKYRAWREYRDRYPHLVTPREADNEYPALTTAVESLVPRAAGRRCDRSTGRSPRASAWASGRAGAGYLVYSVAVAVVARPVGRHHRLRSDLDSGPAAPPSATAVRVQGGGIVTLAPPAGSAGPLAAWLRPE